MGNIPTDQSLTLASAPVFLYSFSHFPQATENASKVQNVNVSIKKGKPRQKHLDSSGDEQNADLP